MICLIPVVFFLLFFGVQYAVNQRHRRRWIVWVPVGFLAVLTAGIAITVELSVDMGPWRGLITMAVGGYAFLPALLGAGAGAAFCLGKEQKKKDGEADER